MYIFVYMRVICPIPKLSYFFNMQPQFGFVVIQKFQSYVI